MYSPKLLRQVIYILICTVFVMACRDIQSDYWPTDDWRTSSPEEQKMNSETLMKMGQVVEEQLPHIRSILIVRHGYLVFERYYQGYDQNSYHQIQSVAKSFVSALIGIALQSGYVDSVNQKVIDFFPEYVTSDLDPQVREISLEHLLTMTAGYQYCAGAAGCFPNQGEDPIKFALEQPLTTPPGQEFQYNNATVFPLLVETLARATKMKPSEFANKTLCEPLGMSASCERLSKDVTFRPRDMAKFGYLYLKQGVWDGKQIIPADWVKTSTQRQNKGGNPHGEEYGYLFWVTTVEGYSAYFAGGYGGQFIYVVPDLDIVVVLTSDFDRHYEENRIIVGSFIIPAVVE